MNKDWRQIVKCTKGHVVEAREKLAELVTDNVHSFDVIDSNFIENCDYITAVPVEIALTMPERAKLMDAHKNCRWIITGVTAEAAKRLVADYGYSISVPILKKVPAVVCEPENKQPSRIVKLKYSVNGKTVETEARGSDEEIATTIREFFQTAAKLD